MGKYIFLTLLFLVFVLGMGQAVSAPEAPPANAIPGIGNKIPDGPQTGKALFNILDTIVDWVFVIVLTFAIIFIILAGWQFITQGGEPQQVAQARMKLLWGAVGIAVALLAQGALVVVKNILGV